MEWDGFRRTARLDSLYGWPAGRFSPIRKLALAVLEQAVYDAQRNLAFTRVTPIAGVSAFDWLHDWNLVEPWCTWAEISPTRLKRRIVSLKVSGVRVPAA